MRVLIADDEPLAQVALAKVLNARPDVEVVDLANDAVEAFDHLAKKIYDVVLLDISMPEISGIDLVDLLSKSNRPAPSIVFVTAYAEHAISAFNKHAVDYVLKPFSSERINDAIDVAFRRTAGERAARLVEDLPEFRNLLHRNPNRIAIKSDGRIHFLDTSELLSVRAEGNYVLLDRENGSYLLRESISVIAKSLKPFGFIQIHRSVLVNSAFVEELRRFPVGEYGLRMKGGMEYTVTRSFKKNLRAIAGSWIGIGSFAEKQKSEGY